ncbi:MAG TPA: thioesterase family protein [Actinomycetota bacterium]|nr:thioesterase family protein [Actinomycetota bacterium]
MTDSFYVRVDDDRFESTLHTIGPWSNEAQHAGPPSALIGRAVEAVDPSFEGQVARITFDILGPVPVAPVTVSATVIRPGRSVQLVEATLRTDEQEVMHARAWRIRTADLDLETPVVEEAPPAGPDDGDRVPLDQSFPGYGSAMEWVYVAGSFFELGPATCWFRMRYPLIDGEEPSPLTRVLIAADSGNGISTSLDFTKWVFINPDLSVYLHRMPVGEWVCLAARTDPKNTGVGVAASTIYDRTGAIGRGLQSLFIGPR